jgi:pilus assembly protein CpaE
MQVFLVSDHEELGARVRRALLRQGKDCPSANVVSLNLAATRLKLSRPDLVVVALSPEPEHALQVISELRTLTTARILAVGPASDPKLIRRSYQMGVGEYLDEIDLEPELIAALERVQTDVGTPTENARAIAVLGPSGGCGSSTIAVNIATKLAKDHNKVLLVDLKLEAGDLASLLDLRPTHTLADLCQNVDRLDRSMFERSLAEHESGVHLLAPPRNIVDTRYVTAEGVRQALTLGRSLYPYVVLDLDHSFRDEQIEPWSTSLTMASAVSACDSSSIGTVSPRKCLPRRPRKPSG